MENEILIEFIPYLVEIELEKNNLLEEFNKEIRTKWIKDEIVGEDSMISGGGGDVLDTRICHTTYSFSIFGKEVDTITLSCPVYSGYPVLYGGQKFYERHKDEWFKVISFVFSSEELTKKMAEKFNIKKTDFYLNGEINLNNLYIEEEMKEYIYILNDKLSRRLSKLELLESQKKEINEKINETKFDIEKNKQLLERIKKNLTSIKSDFMNHEVSEESKTLSK